MCCWRRRKETVGVLGRGRLAVKTVSQEAGVLKRGGGEVEEADGEV